MNSSRDVLDAVCQALKAGGGTGSDYEASKALGLSRQQISRIRNEHGGLGNDAGVKAAAIIGIDPARVLVILAAEHAKTDAERSAWEALLNRLGGMAACLAVCVGLVATGMAAYPSPSEAAAQVVPSTLYYVTYWARFSALVSSPASKPTQNPDIKSY